MLLQPGIEVTDQLLLETLHQVLEDPSLFLRRPLGFRGVPGQILQGIDASQQLTGRGTER